MASPHLEIPTLATAVTDVLTLMDDNTNLLDQALQGDTSIVTTAGGTITVASSISLRNFYLKLTGTPGAGFNLDLPSNNRYFSVDNRSGQIATVRIAGGGGASFAIPVGEIYLLYIDGTDVINIIGGTGGGGGATAPTRTTVTLSGASTSQAIPAGCTHFSYFGDFTISSGAQQLYVQLYTAGDTVQKLFLLWIVAVTTASTTSTRDPSSAYTGFAAIEGTTTVRGIAGTVHSPRDATKKTISNSRSYYGAIFRSREAVAVTATDDDTIRFVAQGGATLTGSVEIEWYYN